MALANVLTTDNTSADSADQAITVLTRFALKGGVGPGLPVNGCVVDVQIKDDAGVYYNLGSLSTVAPVYVDLQPGTYRFSRKAGGAAVGVFSAA